MAYSDHFRNADETVKHVTTVVATLSDDFVRSRYVGLIAVVAVCVYELAIKDIFETFSRKKHGVFGDFTRAHFDRINGRIKRSDLADDYIKRFGDKYVKRFKAHCDTEERKALSERRTSILTCYGNIIAWRHQFAHEGVLPTTATFEEATKAYEEGKQVIHCLARSMTR